MKPACLKCQRLYRPKRSGVRVIEAMPVHADAKPGTEQPELWKPYKLWYADYWVCEGCSHELISGWATCAAAEHYQADFAEKAEGSIVTINDC